MSLAILTSFVRKNGLLIGLFLLICVCYGVFAWQGALPLMSPDETATWSVAHHLGQTGSPTLTDARTATFSWLHPRSFVAQAGTLFPVGFPLWSVLLGLVGWVGKGGMILWLAVIVSASFVFPLAWIMETVFHRSRNEGIMIALTVATLPTMIVYGNRSLFTLVPQLACLCWAAWLMLCSADKRGASAVSVRWLIAGAFAALTIGFRIAECVWILPLLLGILWHARKQDAVSSKGIVTWMLGFLLGGAVVACIHAWVYGSPFTIGYFLRDLPAIESIPAAHSASVARWHVLFPYGFSKSQWWQNLRGLWTMGWWPWITIWAGTVGLWFWQTRTRVAKEEKVFLALLISTTMWLSFYYGQGRFADHIGGQLFHLGNSLFRYQTPVIVAWTIWSLATILRFLPTPWNRRVVAALVLLQVVMGVHWAYGDDQDGILINRQQRLQYAAIRELVEKNSAPETIWVSERSDKMLFPARAATSAIPSMEELKRFLKTQKQPVWLFRRPPSQRERDVFSAQGLDLIERYSFERELIYEVRLKAGY